MAAEPCVQAPPRVPVIGVPITAVDLEGCVRFVEENLDAIRGSYLCLSNAHTTVMAHDDPAYFEVQAGSLMSLPDGKPLSVIGRRSEPSMGRVTGLDLLRALLERSPSHGWSHYFYGSTPENLGSWRPPSGGTIRGFGSSAPSLGFPGDLRRGGGGARGARGRLRRGLPLGRHRGPAPGGALRAPRGQDALPHGRRRRRVQHPGRGWCRRPQAGCSGRGSSGSTALSRSPVGCSSATPSPTRSSSTTRRQGRKRIS